MLRGAVPGGAVIQLPGICPRVGDQPRDVARRHRGMDDQQVRGEGDQRDRGEVALRLIGQGAVEGEAGGVHGRARHGGGVAVRHAAGDVLGGDEAGGAGAVLHHDGLAQPGGERVRQEAGGDVGAAAGREAQDEAGRRTPDESHSLSSNAGPPTSPRSTRLTTALTRAWMEASTPYSSPRRATRRLDRLGLRAAALQNVLPDGGALLVVARVRHGDDQVRDFRRSASGSSPTRARSDRSRPLTGSRDSPIASPTRTQLLPRPDRQVACPRVGVALLPVMPVRAETPFRMALIVSFDHRSPQRFVVTPAVSAWDSASATALARGVTRPCASRRATRLSPPCRAASCGRYGRAPPVPPRGWRGSSRGSPSPRPRRCGPR